MTCCTDTVVGVVEVGASVEDSVELLDVGSVELTVVDSVELLDVGSVELTVEDSVELLVEDSVELLVELLVEDSVELLVELLDVGSVELTVVLLDEGDVELLVAVELLVDEDAVELLVEDDEELLDVLVEAVELLVEDDGELLVVVPALTGIVTRVAVGIAQVTAAVAWPLSKTVVVSWNALSVTLPDAGAIASTEMVGVVSVPGTNGPGFPKLILSAAGNDADSVIDCVAPPAVGANDAVPGFAIEPAFQVVPLTW